MGVTFEAVLFDAGGVLVVPDPVRLRAALVPFGARSDTASYVRAHYAGMRAIHEHSEDYDDWQLYYAAFAVSVGVDPGRRDDARDAVWRVYEPWLWNHPLEESLEALRALNERGVPIGVVSNAEGQIEELLHRQAVCQTGPGPGAQVEFVLDSHVVGVSKPDPAFFALAVERLGIPAERVLYIGDSVRNDVRGSRAAGLHPLHLDPYDDHPDAAHDRIRAATEVLDLLDR